MAQQSRTLEQVTSIDFPHSIVPEEVKSLLDYVAGQLRCYFRYTEEVDHSIRSADLPEIKHTQEVVRFAGHLFKEMPQLVTIEFILKRELMDEGSRYSGFQFLTTPGYKLSELNLNEPRLIDDVRRVICDYFEAHTPR